MSYLGRRQVDKALGAVDSNSEVRYPNPAAATLVAVFGLPIVLWLVTFKPF